ncbi:MULTISPECIES: alanine/glycine:cation symporter family protein [Clostridium]|jgi:alanine or glycine:cation symporter, AGCS family|uniref:alanine/glycine:cation symporter family protein n=1 Tax=Clostridium TaxID=1485 RepID=UPI0011589A87|nr:MULTISPECIES: sodium:alanine symporter family protein [Clostridium]MBS5305707.1 sodium:alanine symporter family protein [Clostridium sp.]MDB1932682.1 sodium:alanine symporter family protein [Clostridium tertium]MDB1935981.1 sodium:alanine symporter family protein [Clostridium tertium]MDB1944249.1 sodium:alanine symporter family protein [Clostridium tertium]MDB1950553.1 sodium:alanine symporter family protein [Clostridium tertium]
MLNQVQSILSTIDSIIWGPPLLILLVGTGIYLTWRLKLLQIFKLPLALKYIFSKDEDKDEDAKGDVTSYGALCTALSATIGTGNIVGVATAIKAGGPGALFWMWIAAFFGMATKYAEGLLAIKYREVDENGQMSGGPMYYIKNGLGLNWLAKLFAIFGVGVALLGIGTFGQVKSIADAAQIGFNIPLVATAVVVTILVALVTLGGIKRISSVSEKVVPFMAILYIVGVILVLIFNFTKIPSAISLIIRSAFNPEAALGGAVGITISIAMQRGIGRGVFSNEAGLGSAPIAAAAAKTKSPVKQGLISMTGTFIDTIIICTMTGIVIVVTGSFSGNLEGAALTTAAFENGLPIAILGKYIVNIGLIFFAFTTILGWNYYGERCIEYLFGVRGIKPYKIIFIVLVAIGPFLPLEMIFIIADIVNGLMAFPNLIGLIGLRHVIVSETEIFFNDLRVKGDSAVEEKMTV